MHIYKRFSVQIPMSHKPIPASLIPQHLRGLANLE